MSIEARIQQIRRLYFSGQFFRFLIVGGVALVIHWLARILLNEWMSFNAAIITAYGVGIATAYILNKKYVFPLSKQARHREVMIFVAVNIGAFPVVWALAVLFGDIILTRFLSVDIARALGHGAAITTPVFVNFALHKFVTFKDN
jgi:putative flippase GtrA